MESNSQKQQALQHVLNGLQILCAREAVVTALHPHHGRRQHHHENNTNNMEQSTIDVRETKEEVPLASPESHSDINDGASSSGNF